MSDLTFLSIPTAAGFGNLEFLDTQPKDLKQVEVILKGTSIVTIEMGDGKGKIVIFRPSKATRKLVENYEGWDIDLHVNDVNGSFTPRRAQRITGHVYEAGNDTMIVNTEDQE
jgi:hypothetical protein